MLTDGGKDTTTRKRFFTCKTFFYPEHKKISTPDKYIYIFYKTSIIVPQIPMKTPTMSNIDIGEFEFMAENRKFIRFII